MAGEAIAFGLDYRRDNGLEIPPSDAGRAQLVTIAIPAA